MVSLTIFSGDAKQADRESEALRNLCAKDQSGAQASEGASSGSQCGSFRKSTKLIRKTQFVRLLRITESEFRVVRGI